MSRPVFIWVVLGESEILDDFSSDSRGIREVPSALLGVARSRKRLLDSQREALLSWLEPALRWVKRRDERRRWEFLIFGICVGKGYIVSLYQLLDLIL